MTSETKREKYYLRCLKELEAMYFSGTGGQDLHWRATVGSQQSKDKAVSFFQNHAVEFSSAFEAGTSATKAARSIGGRHGIFHFRGR
jgi:hypothetical protein